MSDTSTPITFTSGAWITRPLESCTEIIDDSTNEVIGVADHHGDAVLWSCSKNMLEVLIKIQEIITITLPDETPIEKTFLDETDLVRISAAINSAFEKIYNEVAI